jgi:hypothetical protein
VDEDGVRTLPWRGWHVIGRFLPMVFLGLLLVVLAITGYVPHRGREDFAPLLLWIGGILIVFAILGMLFTKCPVCYRTHWVVCFQEPDIVREPRRQVYHRDLSGPEDEP